MQQRNINYSSYHYFFKNKKPLTEKFSSKLLNFLFFSIFIFYFLIIICLNIFLISQKKINFQQLITILFFNLKKSASDEIQTVNNIEISAVNRGIWICLASVVAAVALTISSCCTQSLSQNYIADPTTLGFIDAIIFGIIFLKATLINVIDPNNYHIFYLIFAFLGGILILLILVPLFFKTGTKKKNLNVIFIGLILGIMFKAFSHILKTYNINSVTSSFALAIGGAENIYALYPKQFEILKWSFFAVLVIFLGAWACSKKFNLFELGEENAKTMGLNIKFFKFTNYFFLLVANTIGIVLVGNIAFLGLLSIHIVRAFFKTRKYQIIIPVSSIFSAFLLLIGVLLNTLFPFISSSIFVLFCGAIMLLYLTISAKEK